MASKHVTIRVDEQLHAELTARAKAEQTTVTALITRAAHDAVRDPRLETAADIFRDIVADAELVNAFDAAFEDDSPARRDTASGPTGRAA